MNKEDLVAKKGVKLKPSKQYVEKKSAQEELDKIAESYQENNDSYMQEALELSKKFVLALNNKKLDSEKGPVEKSVEKEILTNFLQLIDRANRDKNQPEGIGSTGGFSLVFSCLFKLRNRLNILEKENADLKTTLNKLFSSESKND